MGDFQFRNPLAKAGVRKREREKRHSMLLGEKEVIF
jgi:hypothetical protein